jgi:hypothetical protein
VPHLLYGDVSVVELSVLDTEMLCDIEGKLFDIYVYMYISNYDMAVLLFEVTRKS